MFDDLDLNDEAMMAEIAEVCQAAEKMAVDSMVAAYEAEGRTEQEIEVMLFLWAHDQEQISMAQAECLQYLWDGGQIH